LSLFFFSNETAKKAAKLRGAPFAALVIGLVLTG
jgi:hypothetical protein